MVRRIDVLSGRSTWGGGGSCQCEYPEITEHEDLGINYIGAKEHKWYCLIK